MSLFPIVGRDINLDVLRVQGYRFFCNKLWNATKFAMMYLGSGFRPSKEGLAGLIKSSSGAGKGQSKATHVPLPPANEITTDVGLEAFEGCFKSNRFLGGGDQATQVDAVAFSAFTESPSYWKYKATCQWYHRMNAMTLQERKSLPKGPGGMLKPQPAPLTLMDKWILSKLALTADQCHQGFVNYNFPQATSALYNFWLYELCDVYLEYLKPVFATGSAAAVATARSVLHACLDNGLRLISPFMPFISEELYQRLPKAAGSDVTSITVADYPKDLPGRNEALEKQVEFVQKVSAVVRSTRADYNLPNKTKTDLYIRVFDDKKLASQLRDFTDVLTTSAYANKIVIAESDADVPAIGCAIVTVSDKCAAHLMLKGIIDPAKEVEKLEKKQGQLRSQLDKLKKAVSIPNYESKVPEDVRKANSEKLSQTETEIERLTEAMASLKAM